MVKSSRSQHQWERTSSGVSRFCRDSDRKVSPLNEHKESQGMDSVGLVKLVLGNEAELKYPSLRHQELVEEGLGAAGGARYLDRLKDLRQFAG